MSKFFAYVRVSTEKQGEHGVSLQEQRDSITGFARRLNVEIVSWFEERETAAKRGRPVFNQMLRLLKNRKAEGVILHKIDRGARNLKDWADLGELVDNGMSIHFSNDSVDLQSRGGRLSADIQAVVAADYIRNLREETRKGFYGRLKQGLLPLPAPVGYLDCGKGKRKEIHPEQGPLVRRAFELYATGKYNQARLVEDMFKMGLRNKAGGKITLNGMSRLLNNRFYTGLIYLKQSKQTFAGIHEPLVPQSLFDRVQDILSGKTNPKTYRHYFVFSKLLQCRPCQYSLVGETQKGHIYYRCHTVACSETGIREEAADTAVRNKLALLQTMDIEKFHCEAALMRLRANWAEHQESLVNAVRASTGNVENRFDRLTDAYLDHLIDKETFENRKIALLTEKQGLKEKLHDLEEGAYLPDRVASFLELATSAYLTYETASAERKRELVETVTSNREVEGKNAYVMLKSEFEELANRPKISSGSPTGNRTPI